MWLVGAACGALPAWVLARRAMRQRAGAPAAERPLVVPGYQLPFEPTLDTLLRLLVDEASVQVELPCAIALRDQDGGPIRVRAVSAAADRRLIGREVDIQSLGGRVVTEGSPIVEAARHPVLGASPADRRRAVSGGVGVPIVAGPRIFGALIAFGEPAIGLQTAVGRLDPLARGYGPLLLPALAADTEFNRALTDPLTELPNRRGFDKAMARARDRPRALILVDIDHFKAVNDTHGHAVGDAALRHFARIVRQALREGDTAARVGGEEFAVVLPDADLALGLQVAERLRVLVEAQPFRRGEAEQRLTVSCGVSASPEPIADPANLVVTADQALYRAKRAGRNRVEAVALRGLPAGPRSVGDRSTDVAQPGGPA